MCFISSITKDEYDASFSATGDLLLQEEQQC